MQQTAFLFNNFSWYDLFYVMYNHLKYLILISILSLMSCAVDNEFKSSSDNEVFAIDSEILNEKRQILIRVPDSHSNNINGKKKYPVIYVLDGEDMFEYVSGIVTFLSAVKGNRVLPESVVIGIPNINRNKDLTHEKIDIEPDSGHGSKFADFIMSELSPYIEDKYPVFKHRTIIGHSFGGLFAINLLNKHPEFFDNYLAIDPSYQYVQHKEVDYSSDRYVNKKLFLAIANTYIPDSIYGYKRSFKESNKHFDELVKLSERLKSDTENSLESESQTYMDDDHASLCVEATYDGLKSLFKWYKTDVTPFVLDDKRSKESIMAFLEQRSLELTKHFKEPVAPDESFVIRIANSTGDKRLKKELLILNLKNNPKSFNAHYSLGLFFQHNISSDSAKIYYNKALDYFDSPELKQKLKDLND